MIISLKVAFCVLLMLGLVSCQNGDPSPTVEGSGTGSGEGEAGATEKAPVSVQIFTHKPEDTTSEAGSGDDEDYRSNTTSRPSTTTMKATTRPTDDEDSSGSGSGEEPLHVTADAAVVTVSMSTKLKTTEVITEKPQKTSTKIPMTRAKTTAAATTLSNYIEDTIGTPTPVTADIEVINSPTVGTKSSTISSKSTTEMSNVIPELPRDKDLGGNTAKQTGKTNDSKQALSFTTGIIIGVVVGAILALLVILFLVYRLRKKDEGSYSLEEPITGYTKQEPGSPVSGKEYFA